MMFSSMFLYFSLLVSFLLGGPNVAVADGVTVFDQQQSAQQPPFHGHPFRGLQDVTICEDESTAFITCFMPCAGGCQDSGAMEEAFSGADTCPDFMAALCNAHSYIIDCCPACDEVALDYISCYASLAPLMFPNGADSCELSCDQGSTGGTDATVGANNTTIDQSNNNTNENDNGGTISNDGTDLESTSQGLCEEEMDAFISCFMQCAMNKACQVDDEMQAAVGAATNCPDLMSALCDAEDHYIGCCPVCEDEVVNWLGCYSKFLVSMFPGVSTCDASCEESTNAPRNANTNTSVNTSTATTTTTTNSSAHENPSSGVLGLGCVGFAFATLGAMMVVGFGEDFA